MLDWWLSWNEREPCSYAQFEVIDVEEVNDLSPEVRSYLVDLLCAARFEPGFLEDVARDLGWPNVMQLIVATQMPITITARRGEFGETLFSAVLEQFHGYVIPVPKLRFKFSAGQSLPGTDVLALRTDDEGSITEVCFGESKLRTGRDNMAAVDGYNQLQDHYESHLPDIVKFVAQRLRERNDPLYDSFKSYMRDRIDTTDRDTFRLSLCWDSTEWRENALENLEEDGVELRGLTVHVVRISSLREITDELFAQFGVTEVRDDD